VVLEDVGVVQRIQEQRQVKNIKPCRRLVGVVDVVVPLPLRGGDEVVVVHREFLARDDRLHLLVAVDGEPERARRVAVRGRGLARGDRLDADVDGVRNRVGRVDGDRNPALEARRQVLDGDVLLDAVDGGLDVVPLPDVRPDVVEEVAHVVLDLPQRDEVVFVEETPSVGTHL